MDKETDNMDKKKYKYGKISEPIPEEVPTIVVEGPSYEKLPYVDEEKDEKDDTLEELNEIVSDEEESRRYASIDRRNSISLPNLDDLKVFTEKVDISDYGKDGEAGVEGECVEDDEFRKISGGRNVRRKSVLSPSPRMLKPSNEEVEAVTNSPGNSITSVNSIASLLREKIQTLPQTLRKKKSPEYKTKIFVALLFIAIVVLIVTAYVLYQQKVLAKAYFERIKLNKVERMMKIYSRDGRDILRVTLGTTVNYDKVLQCLPVDDRNDGSYCLEWMHRARLYLSYYQPEDEIKCYNLHWISLSQHISPTDCFDLSNAHWYGGGQTKESAWPLEKGNHPFHPFITGAVESREWGNVLKRYFISSNGVAIIIDDHTPLHITIQERTAKKELCVRAEYDDFAFVNRFDDTPHLNYSICTGSNMSELHAHLSENTLWDGLKKEDTNIIDSLLTEPVWEVTSEDKEELTEEIVYNFTNDITNSVGVLKQGHVLINEFWQNQVGDFELDMERFPTLEKTMEMLKRRGFRVVFTIQPFISTESFNFAEAVRQGLLVSERHSDSRIPALTRYKTVGSAGVLDVTNNRTVPWLLEKLRAVMQKYKFDAYYLDMGTAYDMPHYYQCETKLLNPDQYKTIFINRLQGALPIFGVGSAIERPKAPSFVVLPQFESSWDGLRRVIPTILTYGIIGYPFLVPGAVGGDYEELDTSYNNTGGSLPDQELYMRWLQLAAFLPVVRYHHLPSSYGNKHISNMSKTLALNRRDKVIPRLKKFARVALNLGLPIIRPLWMLDSEDPNCQDVEDQFAIGDEIIVAPILKAKSREREIYLPAGVWKDGIDSTMRKGSRSLHNYRVEENQVAYFERMPDNTRF